MHTGMFLSAEMFDVELQGRRVTAAELLNWGPRDRLGIVVTSALGGLGASLLVQLAITSFYDAAGHKRREQPIYPDHYLFHVGGRHGNHGAFDFAPERKEVFVATDDILGSINSHGITHLLVPDGEPRSMKHYFKEPEAAIDRIKQCFAYDSEGSVANGDVVVCGRGPAVLRNSTMTLWPENMLKDLASRTWSSPAEHEDKQNVIRSYRERAHEVSDAVRESKTPRFEAAEQAGSMKESYRRVDVGFALSRIGPG